MKLPVELSKTTGRAILLAKKNAPGLFFGAGLVGVVTSTVMACRSTLKLAYTLDSVHEEIETTKFKHKAEEGEKSYFKALTLVYEDGTYKIVKLYAPAAIIGSLSIAALSGSYVILNKRNAALTAAYGVLATSYSEYRDRVHQELGDGIEEGFYAPFETEKVTKVDDDGKKVKVDKVINDPTALPAHARFFDEASPCWQKDPILNKLFIQCQEDYANDILMARGHIFLNEVYDSLGLERSSSGAMLGWVNTGDEEAHRISFGLDRTYNDGINSGTEQSCILDFNVDGVIYDKI